jgi:hypothetical protein
LFTTGYKTLAEEGQGFFDGWFIGWLLAVVRLHSEALFQNLKLKSKILQDSGSRSDFVE